MVTCNPDEAKSGKYVDNACQAHLFIQDQELASNSNGEAVKLTFTVLAATDPLQVGKELSDFFPCSGGAVNKFLNVAEAARLITAAQRAAAVQNKSPLAIDETQFKGRQICANIAMERKQVQDASGKWIDDPSSTKSYPHVNFDTFDVASDKAKNIPKDQQMLAMFTSAATAAAQTAAQPNAAPQQKLDDMF